MYLKITLLSVLLLPWYTWRSSAATTRCEKIDGDCPRCAHPWLAGQNPVAEVHLSGESALVASAARADAERAA